MKIIHLISGGDGGGAKTHVLSLLQGLGRTEQVQLVCFREGLFSQEAEAMGIPTLILPGRDLFKTLSRLKRLIREGGYELIHCHGSRANMIGALLKPILGLPVITTVHSDYQLDYLGRPLHRIVYGTINTVALRLLDYRIGVSDAMVDLLIRRGFAPERLFAIYNGLDFSRTPPPVDREAYFSSVGLKAEPDSVVVGIAARLDPVKDVATLIRGFALAAAECPGLRLLIAGDGEERQRLEALAAELGVSDRVCFAGWVTDMDRFYQAIDINTLTSLSETFPYALTEGARMKLPTVSSNVGGVPYLIDSGVNGLLFPPGDAEALSLCLILLARDPERRKELGLRLYRKASEQFSLESTCRRQLEIYRAVLRREAVRHQKRRGVTVCGAYGRGNAGDDAILEAILSELRDIDPDMPICVLSRNPRETRLKYRAHAVYTFNAPAFLYRFAHSRLYINGGGSLIQDVTSCRSLWFYLFTLSAAKRLGCRVLMYGCGIGPIRYRLNRRLAAHTLNRRVDCITLREPHSREALISMGVSAPRIILSADPTLTLAPAAGSLVDALLSAAGIPPEGNYICFALRRWPGLENKLDSFRAAAEYAYEKYGLTPVFLPVEPRIDLPVSRLAAEGLKVPCHILSGTSSASETIGILARMKTVISMRLHALVFAAGQGVPLVGVVYDPKVSSFLQYIGQDLFVPLNQVTADLLKHYIDGAVQRGSRPGELAEAVRRLRGLEKHNSEAAREFLL